MPRISRATDYNRPDSFRQKLHKSLCRRRSPAVMK